MVARTRTALVSVASALILSSLLAAPATAATGWLDPTFGPNGWVRLPPFIDERREGLVVAAGPSGRLMIGVQVGGESVSWDLALVVQSNGSVLPTFNGGAWRLFSSSHDAHSLAGFFATAGAGVVGVPGQGEHNVLPLAELDATGALVRRQAVFLDDSIALNANVVRLPGGSLRTCSTVNVDPVPEHGLLIGFTSTFAPDPALGPSGQRDLESSDCNVIGADTAGHLYLATRVFRGAADDVIDVMRTTTSGVVDAAWSGDGHAVIAAPGLGINIPDGGGLAPAGSPMLAHSDGSLFVAARATRDPSAQLWSAALAKLNPAGDPDVLFDGDGIRAFGPAGGQSRIWAMAVDPVGRPVVSVVYNYADGHTRAYLARFTTTGSFDQSFGNGGLIEQTHPAVSIAIDAQGRIVTAAWDGTSVIVARRNG